MTHAGSLCDCGKGRFNVYRTVRASDTVVRYLKCPACGKTEKSTVPAEYVRRREVITR